MTLNGMQILHVSTALPENKFSNENLIETFPCPLSESIRQNIRNLGVTRRFLLKSDNQQIAGHETLMDEKGLLDLCTIACTSAMRRTALSAEDIDYLVVAYDANPFLSPGLSQLLVPNLQLNKYVKHVNVQGIASTAFPKALELAKDHLAVHPEDRVLVCVSGVSSYWFQNQVRGIQYVMDIKQINTIKSDSKRIEELRKWVSTIQYFLFGDGVAAAIVARDGSGFSFDRAVEVTNVSKKDYLAGFSRLAVTDEPFKFGFFSHLDKEIPTLGVRYTHLALERLFGKDSEEAMRSIRKWAVHTGSEKILRALARHNKIDSEKLKESHEILADFGNLAGASLPFILERISANAKLADGDPVLMMGYGWGFSASACLLKFRRKP
jgi:predicted naringenin-chalcone synthase